jgi:TatD DNase family protein
MYIDTHAHFDICMNEADFSEEQLMADMKTANVEIAVQVSTEQTDFKWCRDFANKYDNIYYTLGIHPSSAFTDEDLTTLKKFTSEIFKTKNDYKLFGIGEAGLDYYWMAHEREKQIELFEFQLQLAKQNNLPIIIHTRDAMQDTIDILKNNSVENGIVHCFSSTKNDASKLLDMGLNISFTGNVTFKKATDLQEISLYVPNDRILFETDCPYLTPVPKRGKKNKPDYVVYIYNFVAGLKNMSVEELAAIVKNNFESLLGNRE